jgi:hypothetical protein
VRDRCLRPVGAVARGSSARTLLRELDAAGLEPAGIDESDWRLLARDELVTPPRRAVNLYCRRT